MRAHRLITFLALATAAGCGSSTSLDTTTADASADGSIDPGGRVPGTPGGGTGGSGGTSTGGSGGTGGAGTGGSGATGGGGTGGAPGTGGTGGVTCGPTCAIYCPNGNVLDDKGCPTCMCKPAMCPALGCDPQCANGVVKDANGCDTCQCAPGPGDQCTKDQCGPAPGAPNYVCPDGKTVAGPACQRTNGVCGWVFVMCPPKCVQTVLCIRGSHWDPSLCKCVPDASSSDGGVSVGCACSDGGVCVRQIGGPAVPVDPPMTCDQPVAGCDAGSACDCLPPKEGKCHADPTVAGLCICDDGVR